MSPGMFLCAQKNEGPIYTALLGGGVQPGLDNRVPKFSPATRVPAETSAGTGVQGPGFTSQHRH